VIDTELTDDLRVEGDARELTRAVQDMRKEAGLALDDRIDLWLDAPAETRAALRPHLDEVVRDVLADGLHEGGPQDGRHGAELQLSVGRVRVSLLRRPSTGG
jgi:isoleucyl-tRNA synthetase